MSAEPTRLRGHRISGWLCSECGVVAKGDGVVPSFELEAHGDQLVPVLRLSGEDGHGQVVTLGFDNLATLLHQAMACQVGDPERGPLLLAGADERTREVMVSEMLARLSAARRGP